LEPGVEPELESDPQLEPGLPPEELAPASPVVSAVSWPHEPVASATPRRTQLRSNLRKEMVGTVTSFDTHTMGRVGLLLSSGASLDRGPAESTPRLACLATRRCAGSDKWPGGRHSLCRVRQIPL
jgi:hypothetical protein